MEVPGAVEVPGFVAVPGAAGVPVVAGLVPIVPEVDRVVLGDLYAGIAFNWSLV